jgi:hypothetical protein
LGPEIFISVGPLKVIGSGSLVLEPANNTATFQIGGGLLSTVRLDIMFQSIPGENARATHHVPGPNHLQLNLINFDNAKGIGFATPLPIGNLGIETYYITFIVHSVGAGKMLSYTLFSSFTSGGALLSGETP